MKNREEVEEKVLELIDLMVCTRPRLEDDLTKDLGLDSLDTVELVMEVEKAFNTCIPDSVAETFANGNQIVDYICNLQD